MKNNQDKIQEVANNYKEYKIWQSELELLEDKIQFMKKIIFKFLTKIEDHKKVELRTFFNRLEGKFRGRIDWLTQKLELYQLEIKSFFKENNAQKLADLQAQQDLLEREIKQLRENYPTMREDFFKLIKPCLRKERESSQSAQAA